VKGQPDRGPGRDRAEVDGAGEPAAELRGHRSLPHTADVRIEAWGRTREECLIEAVCGLVDSFADVTGTRPTIVEYLCLPEGTDEELLLALLNEVITRVDVDGRVPVDAEAEVVDDRVGVRLAMAELDEVQVVAAAPKAISLHQLRFATGPRGWACRIIVDT
jgi:SHS2 domain-containing protein